jgi:hypothetical protein
MVKIIDNTNFIMSDKEQSNPVRPVDSVINCGKGLEFSNENRCLQIDREWVKRLLDDYKKWLNCNCTDPLGRKINNDEFLETSEVWNGKNN